MQLVVGADDYYAGNNKRGYDQDGVAPDSRDSRSQPTDNNNSPRKRSLSPSNDLDKFKNLESNLFTLSRHTISDNEITTNTLSLWDRLTAWTTPGGKLWHGTEVHQTQNKKFKEAFYNALVKAEGEDVARFAVFSAGLSLPDDWKESPKELSGYTIKRVLKKAESWHRYAIRSNNSVTRWFTKAQGENSFSGVFTRNMQKNNWLAKDINSPQLREIFELKVKQHPEYTHHELITEELNQITIDACKTFYDQKRTRFNEAHPGLAEYIKIKNKDCAFTAISINPDFDSIIDELGNQLNVTSGDNLSDESVDFHNSAQKILEQIRTTKTLFTTMAYEPKGWLRIITQSQEKIDQLSVLKEQISTQAMTKEEIDVKSCLIEELDHQQKMLTAKIAQIEEEASYDPFSEKVVAYSNLLWAKAAKDILFEEIDSSGHAEQELSVSSKQAIEDFVREKEEIYAHARTTVRVDIPTSKNKSTHPVTLGRDACIEFLKKQLTVFGSNDNAIERLTDKKQLKQAYGKALNDQNWDIQKRTVLAHKNGLTRAYEFITTPARHISKHFARLYAQGRKTDIDGFTPLSENGTSAADKSNPLHPRNLKLIQVKGGHVNATYIGHGVLDMWDLDDEERVAANKNGAKEVLEAAFVSNDRIREKALKGKPVKMTHVSVNLTTPAGWREVPIIKNKAHDYQEKTYTDAQFKAFSDNEGDNVFQLDNPEFEEGGLAPLEVDVNVTVDVITFSFGINPIATSALSEITGGWNNVYEHNYHQMERFIGNLGTKTWHTKESRVQGSAPGGFIGSVMEQLTAFEAPESNKKQALINKLQQQTDTVRELFLSDAFKRGNDDPAKMGREIMALQLYADEALNMVDSDEAATCSKGCKSDKDRGGVTDVEIKYKLITEDLGGVVVPDEVLVNENQNNYNMIATTQLQIQQLSCGLPGSKEIKNLWSRVQDKVVMTYLRAYEAFSAA